jgi:replicative DNA helicase
MNVEKFIEPEESQETFELKRMFKIKDNLILSGILKNEKLFEKTIPVLSEELFEENASKDVFSFVKKYYETFSKIPNLEALRIQFVNTKKKDKISNAFYEKLIEDISKIEPAEHDFMLSEIEEWIKYRKYMNVLLTASDISIEGNLDYELPKKIEEALSFSFSQEIGLEINDAEKIWDSLAEREKKIPFSLPILNQITNNGVASKTLNVLLSSSSGGGKTLIMCFLAGEYYRSGKNVLYLTAEMSEKRIYERILANLLDIEINALMILGKEKFVEKVKQIDEKSSGRLVVKEFPTCSANCNDIRTLLKELEVKQNFVPDVIFLDYLNIFSSVRFKKNENMYVTVKGITEEFRGLLVEKELIGWTATQGNRSAIDMDDMSQKNVSESLGVVHTADFMLGVISNDNLNNIGQYKLKQLKNRYNGISGFETFYISVDKAKMRLVDNINKLQQVQTPVLPQIKLKNISSSLDNDKTQKEKQTKQTTTKSTESEKTNEKEEKIELGFKIKERKKRVVL